MSDKDYLIKELKLELETNKKMFDETKKKLKVSLINFTYLIQKF